LITSFYTNPRAGFDLSVLNDAKDLSISRQRYGFFASLKLTAPFPVASMKFPVVLSIFILLASLFVSAQDTSPAAKTSSLAGTVVKEPGSEPLKKVLVQVVAENQKDGGNYTTSTDANGHFRVENVTPARYRIFVERTGFAGVNPHGFKSDVNVVTIQAGQSIDDLLFRMLPTAVLSGRITDEDGDPMSDVRVVALKKVPGKVGREGTGTTATNDLGEYRLAGLFPGQYWIVATPPPDYRDYEKQADKSPSSNTQTDRDSMRYLTTYYPGTLDGSQASPLTIKAGDEMPVNLTLTPMRTYSVRGAVAGVIIGQKIIGQKINGQKPSVELISKTGDSYHANEIGPDGEFEIRGVGPGSYVLVAWTETGSQSLAMHQNINVVAADVEGLKLALLPSFTISGHLRIEGSATSSVTQYVANLRQADPIEDTGFLRLRTCPGQTCRWIRSATLRGKT
jgi:Carboxypeptidase regulatory-like domain